ncbi:hypothetical protein [Nocardia niigatensis]
MRLPAVSRRRESAPVLADKPHKTRLTAQDSQRTTYNPVTTNWTVQSGMISGPVNSCAHAGGPVEDLSSARVEELVAEVLRLRAEVHQDRLLIDDLLDRESMHALTPRMECLTSAAALDRLGAPRARHQAALVEVTAASTRVGVRA